MRKYPKIRHLKKKLDLLDDVVITEKVHGTNARFGLKTDGDGWKFLVGSRNQHSSGDPANFDHFNFGEYIANYPYTTRLIDLAEDKYSHVDQLVVFGEWYEPGMHGHTDLEYSDEPIFTVFDVMIVRPDPQTDTDIRITEALSFSEVERIADLLEMECVPVLQSGHIDQFMKDNDLPTLQELADADSELGGKMSEGIVIRHQNKAKFYDNTEWPCVKLKNGDYLELGKQRQASWKNEDLPDQANEVLEKIKEAEGDIVQSVYDQLREELGREPERKDTGQYVKTLIEDVKSEYDLPDMNNDQEKIFRKRLGRTVSTFHKMIDQVEV